jgi:hypothetical protein
LYATAAAKICLKGNSILDKTQYLRLVGYTITAAVDMNNVVKERRTLGILPPTAKQYKQMDIHP